MQDHTKPRQNPVSWVAPGWLVTVTDWLSFLDRRQHTTLAPGTPLQEAFLLELALLYLFPRESPHKLEPVSPPNFTWSQEPQNCLSHPESARERGVSSSGDLFGVERRRFRGPLSAMMSRRWCCLLQQAPRPHPQPLHKNWALWICKLLSTQAGNGGKAIWLLWVLNIFPVLSGNV